MTAWMLYRGMPRRAVWEMTSVMPLVAAALLLLGWIGALRLGDLALVEHGLTMPAMLVPMLARVSFYSGAMHRYAAT